ncbi:hypothetical protein JCM13210_24010 [Thermaerobacter litoralis]
MPVEGTPLKGTRHRRQGARQPLLAPGTGQEPGTVGTEAATAAHRGAGTRQERPDPIAKQWASAAGSGLRPPPTARPAPAPPRAGTRRAVPGERDGSSIGAL